MGVAHDHLYLPGLELKHVNHLSCGAGPRAGDKGDGKRGEVAEIGRRKVE